KQTRTRGLLWEPLRRSDPALRATPREGEGQNPCAVSLRPGVPVDEAAESIPALDGPLLRKPASTRSRSWDDGRRLEVAEHAPAGQRWPSRGTMSTGQGR